MLNQVPAGRALELPEGGHDAGPWRHNLLALVVANGERIGDGRLQRYALLHHRAIDLRQQPLNRLDAAFRPLVRKACRCVGYARTRRELELDADLAPLVADSPSAPMRCGLQSFLPGLLFGLPRQGLRINLRIKLVPDALRCN